jgi:hypothetical protein
MDPAQADSTTAERGSDDMTNYQPLFRSVTGAYGGSPDAVAGKLQVSRGKLAQYLANPVLETNVGGPCPWQSVDRIRTPIRLAAPGTSNPDDIRRRFQKAVTRAIGDGSPCAMFYSGGLDSFALAIEAAAQCRAQDRELIPIIWDMEDQTGTSTASIALPQLQAIGEWLEPIVIDAGQTGMPEAEWSSCGPRTDWNGPLRRHTEEIAASRGATVLLSGEGGDEVFSAWNFATSSLLAARRPRDLSRYIGAFARHETILEVVGELLSLGTPLMSNRRSFRGYLAFGRGKDLVPDPGDVVHPSLVKAIEDAHTTWLRDRFEIFRRNHQDWSRAGYYDEVYPFVYDVYPTEPIVPERSPYLDPEMIAWSAGLPAASRFDSRGVVPYHWYKALQIRLIPERLRPLMPRYKAHYGGAYRRFIEAEAPRGPLALHKYEVMQPLAFEQLRSRHSYLPLMARNLELWLQGALERGYNVTD